MTSPLLDDGSLDYDNQNAWPGPAMSELPEEQWPTDRQSLESWALSRVEVHFDACWEAAVADWESSPNRSGSVADADPEEALEMIRAGIRMHLDQVHCHCQLLLIQRHQQTCDRPDFQIIYSLALRRGIP